MDYNPLKKLHPSKKFSTLFKASCHSIPQNIDFYRKIENKQVIDIKEPIFKKFSGNGPTEKIQKQFTKLRNNNLSKGIKTNTDVILLEDFAYFKFLYQQLSFIKKGKINT